jgi:hypothetical protein
MMILLCYYCDIFSNGSLQKKNGGKDTQLLKKELERARFLIAESEKELQFLFRAYLDLIGVQSEIVDDGNRALTTFPSKQG